MKRTSIIPTRLSFLLFLLFPSPSFATDPAYTVCAGDILQITVWKEEGLDRETLVLPDGTISFPLAGIFNAKGMTLADVQATIKSKLKNFIPNASVSVIVKAPLGHTVSVIGEVTKPGEFVMGHRMTAMQALSMAGGPTPFAGENGIIVMRHEQDKETSTPIPYKDIVKGEKLDKDIALAPGDVIIVPTASLF